MVYLQRCLVVTWLVICETAAIFCMCCVHHTTMHQMSCQLMCVIKMMNIFPKKRTDEKELSKMFKMNMYIKNHFIKMTEIRKLLCHFEDVGFNIYIHS